MNLGPAARLGSIGRVELAVDLDRSELDGLLGHQSMRARCAFECPSEDELEDLELTPSSRPSSSPYTRAPSWERRRRPGELGRGRGRSSGRTLAEWRPRGRPARPIFVQKASATATRPRIEPAPVPARGYDDGLDVRLELLTARSSPHTSNESSPTSRSKRRVEEASAPRRRQSRCGSSRAPMSPS